jgi:hypothetical protein
MVEVTNRNNLKKPGSHLYGRGFLGLIPLIGFFIGIGLILLGAVKYRNRKLVIIGLVALLPTVLIYGSLFMMVDTPETWTTFCQPQMDQIVVNLEFYKKGHSNYPDSLEQLQGQDKTLFILDPVQVHTRTKYGNNYFYRKKDSGYILLSMGVDGIPYTNDDIYPSWKYYDSSLTGLVCP